MEYLKGSYSTSNTQATFCTPPPFPIPCDQDVTRICDWKTNVNHCLPLQTRF